MNNINTFAVSTATHNVLLLLFGLVVVLLSIAGLVFTIWMLVDAIRRPIRHKLLWVIVIVLGEFIGAIIYYFTGRTKLVDPQLRKRAGPIKIVLSVLLVLVLMGLVTAGRVYLDTHKRLKMAPNGVAMEPTIQPGQTFYVTKLVTDIKRGDIVVFNPPNNAAPGVIVLRVIAVAGEHVTISQGKLTVSNNSQPSGFNPDGSYEAADTSTPGNADVVVPSGDVYVLGDNRTNALDSRVFGPIPVSSIVDKVTRY